MANFAAAGTRSVIVSGVVDPVRGVETDLVPGAAMLPCRLRADSSELRRRLMGRSGDPVAAEHAVREAEVFDASDGSAVCVDTTGRSPVDVADEVVRRCGGWTALTGSRRSPAPLTPAALSPAALTTAGSASARSSVPVLFLSGVTGVGKSTVGFEIYMRDLRGGRTAGYVDAGQLGFCHSADDDTRHAIKAANLAAVAANYLAAGAQQLVVTGPVDTERAAATYAAALPAAEITLCRLHAGLDALGQRIGERHLGGSWPEPGDPLSGQSTAFLHEVAVRAAAQAAALDSAGLGVRIETDGLSVADVADLVISTTCWPGTPPRGTGS